MSHESPTPTDPRDAPLHAQLRRLPDLEAPATLVPEVLARIRKDTSLTATPWHRRPASTWPAPARIIFGVATLALVVASTLILHHLPDTLGAFLRDGSAKMFAPLANALPTTARVLGYALRSLLQTIPTSAQIAAVAAAILAHLVLFGLGSRLWRLLNGPRLR